MFLASVEQQHVNRKKQIANVLGIVRKEFAVINDVEILPRFEQNRTCSVDVLLRAIHGVDSVDHAYFTAFFHRKIPPNSCFSPGGMIV